VTAFAVRWTPATGEQWWLMSLWTLGLLVIVLVVLTVPWHMDEFVQYHALACTQPSQQLNRYRDSCFWYTTQLGGWTFQRAYQYIGITSSVLLWPLFTVMNPMLAHYVEGIVGLLVVAAGIASSLNLDKRALPALLLFFPLTFAIVRGAGPVLVGLVVLAWTPVILRRFATTDRPPAKAAWAAALIAMWVIATEDKPFFAYLMPGIVLWSLAGLAAHGVLPRTRTGWISVLGLFAMAGGFAFALLLLTRVEGDSYLTYLIQSSQTLPPRSAAQICLSAILFTLDWPFYAHRVSLYSALGGAAYPWPWRRLAGVLPLGFTWQAMVALGLTLLVIAGQAVAYVWALVRLGRDPAPRNRVTAGLLLGAAVVLAAATVSAHGWANHHFIYMQVPLLGLLALAVSGQRRGLLVLGSVFAAAAVASLAAIALVPRPRNASPEIPVVFQAALAAADRETVINCASWGCYYTYSLLNVDDVPVVYAGIPRHTGLLATDMRSQGRRILHLCYDCNAESVQQLYPQAGVAQVSTGTKVWKLFRVNPG
jgi:hypothetical protein